MTQTTLDYSNQSPPRSVFDLRWVDVAALVLILLVAVVARFAWLGATEAHFDELWHLELSTGRGSAHDDLPHDVIIDAAPDVTSLHGAPSWPSVWTHLESVTHPPLYPLVLRVWRTLFGESIYVGRTLSAVLSAMAVLAMFEASRWLVGTRLSLWAAAIFALSSAQIDMAQEVRNYPLATLAMLLVAAAVLRIDLLGPTRRRVIALTLATLMALLSHYFVAPVLAAIGLYALVAMRDKSRWHCVLGLLAGLAIFAIAWGPMMPRQWAAIVGASTAGSLGDTSTEPIRMTFQRLATLPLRQLFEPRDRMLGPALGSASLFILPWIVLSLAVRRKRLAMRTDLAHGFPLDFTSATEPRTKKDTIHFVKGRVPFSLDDPSRALLFWALWLTFAAGFPGVMDLLRRTRHLEELRHTIFAGPAVVGVLVSLAITQRTLIRYALPVVALLACLASVGLTYTRQNPDYEYMARMVADRETANLPIVFYSNPKILWWSDLLFMGAGHYSGTFPRTVLRLSRPATPELIAQLHRWPRFWLVSGATDLGPTDIVPGVEPISTRTDPHLGSTSMMRWPNPATMPVPMPTTRRGL